MQAHPRYAFQYWRSTIALTCSFVMVCMAFVWNARKGTPGKPKPPITEEKEKPDIVNGTVNHQDEVEEQLEEEEQTIDDTIPELPEPNWVKVGQIQELFMYPLKSGRGKELKECNFTRHGICVEKEGRTTLRDRMFLVYNEETGRFQTGRQYPTLILVSLSAVDESRVKLEALGMPSVVFSVPKCHEEGVEAVECKMWWGEPVKCIDCGPEPAEWISRFLTGTSSGLRLGYTVMDQRTVTEGPWKKFTDVYQTLRDEDTGLFCDLASYMLMTTQSVERLNEKLERPVPALQFRPNILISTNEAFAEDNWEWIRIGERAVIRNIKPCSRCKFVLVNPETGVVDTEEPLKTLKTSQSNGGQTTTYSSHAITEHTESKKIIQSDNKKLSTPKRTKCSVTIHISYSKYERPKIDKSASLELYPNFSFRQHTEPERIALEGTAPTMGVYCGLYVPGKVKIEDDVFVHIPKKSSNHQETRN